MISILVLNVLIISRNICNRWSLITLSLDCTSELHIHRHTESNGYQWLWIENEPVIDIKTVANCINVTDYPLSVYRSSCLSHLCRQSCCIFIRYSASSMYFWFWVVLQFMLHWHLELGPFRVPCIVIIVFSL